MLLDEVDQALRPPSTNGGSPAAATILEPSSDPATWASATGSTSPAPRWIDHPLAVARRFADGLSSWLLRRTDGTGTSGWSSTDPPGRSGTSWCWRRRSAPRSCSAIPAGAVRIVGRFGVLRWEGFRWHHEPPISSWIDA